MIDEHRERLEAMVEDNGQTWDLSDNDKTAIQWALDEIKRLRTLLAALDYDAEMHVIGSVETRP